MLYLKKLTDLFMKNLFHSCIFILLSTIVWAISFAAIEPVELGITKHVFTIKGVHGAIYAIPTGTIQIKHCHFENCLDDDTSYPLRLLRILFAHEKHNERLPIYTYLIDHPEGKFLVDAGGDRKWNDDQSWSCDRRSKFVAKTLADVQVPENKDLVSQLNSLNIEPKQINSVIITHLHFDHTGALKELDLPTYVGGADLDASGKIGAVTCKYLDGVNLLAVESLLNDQKDVEQKLGDKLFGPSISLTTDGNLRIYLTPGHTPGSLSLNLNTDQGQIWFIGDITFSDSSILSDSKVSGMHFNIKQVRKTHENLRIIQSNEKSLFIPSHDKLISKKIESFLNGK